MPGQTHPWTGGGRIEERGSADTRSGVADIGIRAHDSGHSPGGPRRLQSRRDERDCLPDGDLAFRALLGIARGFSLTGSHVYAARLPERRFRDMEPDLPERYQEPALLAHQREVHGALIEKGLRLIADSYLQALEQRCRAAGVAFGP